MSQSQHPLKKTKRFFKQHAASLSLLVFILMVSLFAIEPERVFADTVTHPTQADSKATALQVSALQNNYRAYGVLPVSDERHSPQLMRVPMTAYSSTVEQCDSTPFITASGTHVRDGVIAANFLPIGTRVKIPDLYGNKTFVVEDRMNSRYDKQLDIWMESTEAARQFGRRTATIEVYW